MLKHDVRGPVDTGNLEWALSWFIVSELSIFLRLGSARDMDMSDVRSKERIETLTNQQQKTSFQVNNNNINNELKFLNSR
jgi:hypothetical protein